MADSKPTRTAHNFQDLTGQRFGKLVVVGRGPDYIRTNGKILVRWNCRCDCGGTTTVMRCHLKSGATQACGCTYRTRNGMSDHPLFPTYNGMLARCHIIGKTRHKNYGERGIYVCQGWRESFEAFLADMGPRPSGRHSIDRIDNNGSYTCGHCDECREKGDPANCRWAIQTEQSRNRRGNRLVTFNGETKTLAEWSEITGIGYFVLHCRLKRHWSVERTLTTPMGSSRRNSKDGTAVTHGTEWVPVRDRIITGTEN